MALSDTQVRQLRAKLDGKHVKTRKANGADLHYVEGWHVIAEANRIFGYDAWDRRTLASRCVWSGANGAYHEAAYTAKVRVSVRAGDITIVREGSGSSEAKAPTPGQAHELALKGAETDATKRALATFGNPFGLALYDREQIGVRKTRSGQATPAIGPWALRTASGADEASFDRPSDFAAALRNAMSEAQDIELLFAVWEQNVETVRTLNRSLKQDTLPRSGIAPQLVSHLKQCAVALTKQRTRAGAAACPTGPDSQRRRQNRQERADHWRTKADPIEGAFALRGPAALSDLRAIAKPCPSRPLRTIQRSWAQSQRRIHRPALCDPPSAKSRNWKRTIMVAGTQDRSAPSCRTAMARKPEAVEPFLSYYPNSMLPFAPMGTELRYLLTSPLVPSAFESCEFQ